MSKPPTQRSITSSGGRCGAFEDERKDGDLENVGDDGEDHGDAQARTGGDFDGFAIEVSGRGHGSSLG